MHNCPKEHVGPNDKCTFCLKELIIDQGKVIHALHDRLDYIWEFLPALSSDPEGVKRFLMDVDDRFPPTGKSPTYLLVEDQLKPVNHFGRNS